MIDMLILTLIICALVAAIWGRQAAQNTFGCIMTVVVGAFVVCALLFAGLMSQLNH